MNQPIVSIKDYGHIKLNIKEYMDAHHITRNALARAINTRFEVVNKWYCGNIEKMDTDILARICFVLNCEPGDIIEFVKPEPTSKNN